MGGLLRGRLATLRLKRLCGAGPPRAGQYQRRLEPFEEFVEVFATLICAAQECVRDLCEGERSSASLRDVARSVTVFRWFGAHLQATEGAGWDMEDFRGARQPAHKAIRKAAILAIASRNPGATLQ